MIANPETRATVIAPIVAAVLAWCPAGMAAEPRNPDGGTDAKHASGMALAEVGRGANGFDRNAALYAFVADADPSRMEELLAEASQLGDTPHGRESLRVLYIRYASLDPTAAASHAVRSRAESRILAAVFRAWAHADLDSAVERAATIPTGAKADAVRAILQLDLPPERRKAVADRLGVGTAVAEISKPEVVAAGETHDEALAKLVDMDSDVRWKQRALLSSEWAAADPVAALEAIVDWDGNAELKDSMLRDIMQKWASADARAAMDWLIAREASDLPVLVFPAFEALAGVDLAEAESLVAALPTLSARRNAQIGVFTAIMGQDDLDRAQTAFSELDVQGQLWALSSFGRRLARANPEQAFDWLMGLGNAVRRMNFDWTLTAIHGEDPVLAKQLIQRVEDPELRAAAARVVVERGMTDPAESLRWGGVPGNGTAICSGRGGRVPGVVPSRCRSRKRRFDSLPEGTRAGPCARPHRRRAPRRVRCRGGGTRLRNHRLGGPTPRSGPATPPLLHRGGSRRTQSAGVRSRRGGRRRLNRLAPRPGFEPGTCRLGGGRAIQLCHRGSRAKGGNHTALLRDRHPRW